MANLDPSAENATFGTQKIKDPSGNPGMGIDLHVTKEKFILFVIWTTATGTPCPRQGGGEDQGISHFIRKVEKRDQHFADLSWLCQWFTSTHRGAEGKGNERNRTEVEEKNST